MKVIQNSGEIVDFDQEKLKSSLLKSGADPNMAEAILHQINAQLYDRIPTKKIYKLAFELLKKSSHSTAARYNLKAAIQMLGPAGYFFEKYVGRLFASEGYLAKTNLTLQGKCVSHEVDVAIKKGQELAMVECKFHMATQINSDVKVPMYILSRFNDLKDRKHVIFSKEDEILGCWIVTNNRFTSDAIIFGTCSGINMLSWDYPKNNSLSQRIDKNRLYPVTCLTTLSVPEKQQLLGLDVILVKELNQNPDCLKQIKLSPNRIKKVQTEAAELCKHIPN